MAVLLLGGLAHTAPAPATAQNLDTGTAACLPFKFGYRGWTEFGLDAYSIKAKNLPPERVMVPGETYQIRYEIETVCSWNFDCTDVEPLFLTQRAVVGSDRSQLDGAIHSNHGTVHVERHQCGEVPTRFVTFTVPDPDTLLLGIDQAVVDVSMGLCAPDTRWNCAGHTIKVRNAPTGTWQVGQPASKLRTLAGDYVLNEPIPMTVDVSNFTGAHRYPGAEGRAVIKVAGPFPTADVATLDLPSVTDLSTASLDFTVTPQRSGPNLYFVCLVGLRDANNWVLPDTCGSQLTINARASAPLQFDAVETPPIGQHNLITPQVRPPPQGNIPAGAVQQPPPQEQQAAPLPAGAEPPPPQGNPGGQAQQAGPGGAECRGGEWRGPLCWCGIGRFPHPVGVNVFQCR